MSLIQNLTRQAVDIIGDIHGEDEALLTLLEQLGYEESGYHPEDRQLVFTGDLVDRGPDSPAVMEMVIRWVEAGFAQCVLGNHELNILRGAPKGGNDWIIPGEGTSLSHSRVASPEQRVRFLEFLERQPFVLESPHLRIVHACWNTEAVQALRAVNKNDRGVGEVYREFEANITESLEAGPLAGLKREELRQYSAQISDPDWTPLVLPGHAGVDVAMQMNNPFRVLTTSEERATDTPFWAGGKWRMAERCRWWDHYEESVPVVIGHFWRLFDADARHVVEMFGPDVFEGIPPHAWMGVKNSVYCVDYSVGQRHLERSEPETGEFHGKLAALRYPEWDVMHDDGSRVAIGPPGR